MYTRWAPVSGMHNHLPSFSEAVESHPSKFLCTGGEKVNIHAWTVSGSDATTTNLLNYLNAYCVCSDVGLFWDSPVLSALTAKPVVDDDLLGNFMLLDFYGRTLSCLVRCVLANSACSCFCIVQRVSRVVSNFGRQVFTLWVSSNKHACPTSARLPATSTLFQRIVSTATPAAVHGIVLFTMLRGHCTDLHFGWGMLSRHRCRSCCDSGVPTHVPSSLPSVTLWFVAAAPC